MLSVNLLMPLKRPTLGSRLLPEGPGEVGWTGRTRARASRSGATGGGRCRSDPGSGLGPVSFPRDGASPAAQLGLPSTSQALAERADTEVLRILKDAEEAALNTLADHRAALDSLAKALVVRETVDRSEVDAIVAQAEGSRASKPSC